ncbi:MAG TPA: GNAT family N-acetyltransferase [Actinomycetes bacterium]|nr:GNAT family N-acetyltransferase [Actinomycetes bacterium]
MPAQPVPDRSVLADPAGRKVLSFVPITIGSERWVTEPRIPPGVRLDSVVPAVMRGLPGWIVDGDEELVTALIGAGARRRRHASTMVYDLTATQVPDEWAALPLPPGLSFAPVDPDPERLFATWLRAYPPGHPDAPGGNTRADFEANLAPLVTGRALGPLLPVSGCVVDSAAPGRAVAVCLVNDRPDEGPWISEVFRDPDPRYAGIGAALLRRTLWLASRAGVRSIGLAVTVGNPAQRVYEKVGFQVISTTLNCIIPDPASC